MKTRLVACLTLVASPLLATEPPKCGSYRGNVVASWDDQGRTMTLVENFAYVDRQCRQWDAPTGSKVDGASIPRWAWSIIGGPFEGRYRAASVIHDVACERRSRPWRDVHEVFLEAMRASGVGETKALLMYAAVYHFGPRWGEDGAEIVQLTPFSVTSAREQVACGPTQIGPRGKTGFRVGRAMVESATPSRRRAGTPPEGWRELQQAIEAGGVTPAAIRSYEFSPDASR